MWFTVAASELFARNFTPTDHGVLVDITNTLSRLTQTYPQTFYVWFLFFFTTMILTSIGLIIYQNKAKKDQDFICFTQIADMIRARDPAGANEAVHEMRRAG